MKIIDIFDDQRLLAFHYEGNVENEYDRLMEFWTDVSQVREYAKQNEITSQPDLNEFIESINLNAEYIQDWLYEIEEENRNLDEYFEPLDHKERKKEEKLYKHECVITQQKGKRYVLRIYALRIDLNTYLITGGAIKWTQRMEDHPDTANELVKLNRAINYLAENGVFDKDSLIDLQHETS